MKYMKWMSLLGAAILVLAWAKNSQQVASKDIYDNLDLFANGLALVQRDYVDEVEPQKLIYGALKGMLRSLDPHSQFLDPEAYREIQVETEGQFGGLGVEITMKDDFLTVIAAMEGTPAWTAGILSGDRIVRIDDKAIKDLNLEEAVKRLRGRVGSRVKLSIMREGKKLLEFTIERAVIQIKSISAFEMMEDSIGYVRISEFQEHTAQDLEKVMKDSQAQGEWRGLILDLRNNPGGLLQSAVEVTELFVKRGSLIVETRGRKPSQNLSFEAKRGPVSDVPLVILVNRGSASASEIVAGAIQDLGRGKIVGKKTFGKGSVQSVIPLKDGSALKLTTSKYFTPKGRSIQGTGIQPDIEVDIPREERKKMKEQRREENKAGKKKSVFPDRQLQAAMDVLKSKIKDQKSK
ncbi:MAG: S41 family peptidase [Chlamydiae bacterium]|nr:S41 family peptidase [Chlamydiota bacterium]MBI3266236.1 S41 family peptidase [Chlamydiota bacterium]